MPVESNSLLTRALQLAEDPRVAETLRAHGYELDAELAPRLSTRIHSSDQMLAHSLRALGDADLAVSQYFGVALQQHYAAMQLLRLAFPSDRRRSLRLLDFACGFGRALRLTVASVSPQQVWAADIQAEAVRFVAREFCVHGLESAAAPEAFRTEQQFDFIWVASLFSHLPESLFRAWLTRLLELLSPDGVLCFSVHDESILPSRFEMPPQGIYYCAESENADLDTGIYGTTHVNEAFVRSATERLLGFDHPYLRLPRALANQQDIYVVARGAERHRLPKRSAFRRGAWGWVDCLRGHGSRNAFLSGWARAFDLGDRIERVEVTVDGRVHLAQLGVRRADLAGAFGDSSYLNAGWEVVFPLPPDATVPFVTVVAHSACSERSLIFFGLLDAAALRVAAPWGYLDEAIALPDGGGLRLAGWAESADGTSIADVTASVAGTTYLCRRGLRRDDVSTVLGDDRYLDAGWEVVVPQEFAGAWVPVRVIAKATTGVERSLFAGRVNSATGTFEPD